MTGLPFIGFVATPSLASYRRTIAVRERKHVLPAFGNGSTNDAMFSQTSDKANKRQSSHELHVVNSYSIFFSMIGFDWSGEKNAQLERTRGVCFKDVLVGIENGQVLAIIRHPNRERYPGQNVIVLNMCGYVWLVPYVKRQGVRFL
jgi:hypothetical protein